MNKTNKKNLKVIIFVLIRFILTHFTKCILNLGLEPPTLEVDYKSANLSMKQLRSVPTRNIHPDTTSVLVFMKMSFPP